MATSSSTGHQSTVVGVFQNLRDAQAAVKELRDAGFREDEIGIVAHDSKGSFTTDKGKSMDGGTHAAEGAAAGAAAGAGVGALWAVGIAAGLLPAIGPIVAGGIFGSILASAAGAAALASVAGALVGLGIPEEDASYYENEFKSGRTIVTVKTASRQTEARAIMDRFSGYHSGARHTAGVTGATAAARPAMGSTHTAAMSSATPAMGTGHTSHAAHTSKASHVAPAARPVAARVESEGQTVQLREEQLRAEKEVRKAGEVQVRKEVVTEQKTIQVPVEREEVVIERRPVAGGTRAAGDIAAGAQEIRIPVKEEEVRVEKVPVVKEEVTVGKKKVRSTQTVAANVRHEELRVEETGDVRVTGETRATGDRAGNCDIDPPSRPR